MADIAAARTRLEQAQDLTDVLAAACVAFEELRKVLHAPQDLDEPAFNRRLMAGTYAADGRDTVLFASVLRQQPGPAMAAAGISGTGAVEDTDASLSRLSSVLAARLTEAADQCADRGDRARCRDAALSARAICGLLTPSAP